MDEESLKNLIGKLVLDSLGRELGTIENVSNNVMVVVRGLTAIERTTIPITDIASNTSVSMILSRTSADYAWRDLGVRCENCGNYTKKPVFGFGHYFCSNKCKDQLVKRFPK